MQNQFHQTMHQPEPYLNDKNRLKQFTFEHFLVSSSQASCFYACQAISKWGNDVEVTSPLFIYGPAGAGKTHLVHAIAHAMFENGHEHILIQTGVGFISAIINSIRQGTTMAFRNTYCGADALIIDGFDDLSGKPRSMEELQSIIDALSCLNRPVILTSSNKPAELEEMTPQLCSKLSGGLIFALPWPETSIKEKFIQRTMADLQMDPDHTICRQLALRMNSIREIQGALQTLAAATTDNLEIEHALELLDAHLACSKRIAEHDAAPSARSCALTRKQASPEQGTTNQAHQLDSYSPLPRQFNNGSASIDSPLGSLPFPEWVVIQENSHANKNSITHLRFPRFYATWKLKGSEKNDPDAIEIGALYPLDESSQCDLDNDQEFNACLSLKAAEKVSLFLANTAKNSAKNTGDQQ